MKKILLALMLVAGTSAHAGIFDDIGDVLDPGKNGTSEAFDEHEIWDSDQAFFDDALHTVNCSFGTGQTGSCVDIQHPAAPTPDVTNDGYNYVPGHESDAFGSKADQCSSGSTWLSDAGNRQVWINDC